MTRAIHQKLVVALHMQGKAVGASRCRLTGAYNFSHHKSAALVLVLAACYAQQPATLPDM
eukprot:scaffold251292_cov21-Prasinocladus_malaysianus.AAC.2